DVDPTTVLYARFDGVLVSRLRPSGDENVLGPILVPPPFSPFFAPPEAHLTRGGAVWITQRLDAPPGCALTEAWVWRGGASARVWQTCTGERAAVAGNFLVTTTNGALTERDVLTGVDQTWSWPAPAGAFQVAPDGAVYAAEAGGTRIFRFR